jgi:AraC family transcriptional regulator
MKTLIPSIELLPETIIIGKHIQMSFADNKTGLLWSSFMPGVNDIQNRINSNLISMQLYPLSFFSEFNPSTPFEKWAGVPVSSAQHIPDGLESYTIPNGLYAVFHYVGSSANPEAFQYIFTEWLPDSNYLLDERPHFEVLGEKYKNNDSKSEEDIWIPIKPK